MFKKIAGLFLSVAMVMTGLGNGAVVSAKEQTVIEDNVFAVAKEIPSQAAFQDYFGNQSGSYTGYRLCKNWVYPTKSYLVETDTGYLGVRAFDTQSKVKIVSYDKSFNESSSSEIQIDYELECFGGFYYGSDYNVLVFGQPNKDERNDVEVIRVVKYDKNWNRLNAASVYGANTSIIFEHGGICMVEADGFLHIRTCHTMYKSDSDGRNHQASMSFAVKLSDMSLCNERYEVDGKYGEYASHSFDQKLIVDNGYLVYLDLGDAYPRSAVLGRYRYKSDCVTAAGSSMKVDVLSYPGTTGDNYVGASIGGLEASGDKYLTAGNSAPLDNEKFMSVFVRNAYVSSTSKDGTNTVVNWLTNYPENGNVYASTPQFAKVEDNVFFVAWDIMTWSGYRTSTKEEFSYLFVDGEGNPLGNIYSARGSLSDCKPIATAEGNVAWYTYNGSNLDFYVINQKGELKVNGNSAATVNSTVPSVYTGGEIKDPGTSSSKKSSSSSIKSSSSSSEKKSSSSSSEKKSSSSSTEKGSSSSSSEKEKSSSSIPEKIEHKKITYVVGPDVIMPENPQENYREGYKQKLTTVPSRPGYKFAGWYLDKELKVKAKITKNTHGDLRLYPKWKGCGYTVQYMVSPLDAYGKPVGKQKLTLGKLKFVKTPNEKKVLKAGMPKMPRGWTPIFEAEFDGDDVDKWVNDQIISGADVEIVSVEYDAIDNISHVVYIKRNIFFAEGTLQKEFETKCFDRILWIPKGKGYTGNINLYPRY